MWKTLRSVLRFRRFEFDPVVRRLRKAANVDDLRRIAKRRLPRGVFDYIDGGAEDEVTLTANVAAYKKWHFEPRVLRDMSDIDMSTLVLGSPVAMPLIFSPTGFTRIADPEGELAVARAAGRAGLPYSLSTLSTRSIEEVAAAGEGSKWFQVYMWRDRGLMTELIHRAAAAGYEAIMPTVDTALLGRRERDIRRGFTLPPKIGLETVLDGLMHPGWTWSFVRSDPITFSNVTGRSVGDGTTAVSLADYINSQFDPGLSWGDIEWLRSIWNGPVVLKGIQSVADAKIAVREGIDAIALSNHGGRQLDGAPAPLDLVAPVADVVGGSADIYCDGGVRRGSDIVKAVALGATACMTGRAYLYGLGAAGERGVDHVVELLAGGMRRTMALIGCASVDELSPEYLAAI